MKTVNFSDSMATNSYFLSVVESKDWLLVHHVNWILPENTSRKQPLQWQEW